MKKLIGLLLAAFLINACAKTETISATKGDKGDPGAPGQNAHQTLFVASEDGTVLNLYVDMDDSLTVTEGDLIYGSVTLPAGPQGEPGEDGQNGNDGEQGPEGPQGPAGGSTGTVAITSFTSSSCTAIGSTGLYGKSGSNEYNVYTSSSCHSSSKVMSLDEASPVLRVSSGVLLVFVESNDADLMVFN